MRQKAVNYTYPGCKPSRQKAVNNTYTGPTSVKGLSTGNLRTWDVSETD